MDLISVPGSNGNGKRRQRGQKRVVIAVSAPSTFRVRLPRAVVAKSAHGVPVAQDAAASSRAGS